MDDGGVYVASVCWMASRRVGGPSSFVDGGEIYPLNLFAFVPTKNQCKLCVSRSTPDVQRTIMTIRAEIEKRQGDMFDPPIFFVTTWA